MDLRLEPKQTEAYLSNATEMLYGGAAGGGKSYYLRVSAIRWCLEISGIQVYLFRRTLPDLRDNHLRGPTSFFVMLDKGIQSKQVRYRAQENEFDFPNGSVLHLCYCDSENDVEKYRGAEIHVLLIDELTHFSEYQYRFLRSRVRRAGLKVPDNCKHRLPRIECGSNPGSIGHAWVKRTFISPRPPMELWRTEPDEGGMVRQFIPARLSDNPHLTEEDPDYANRLRGLGADSLVKAMLDGDWDIVAGQAFEKLSRKLHCVEPFEAPQDWLTFGSFDWGSTRPFSYGLWAIADGNALPDGRVYRRGAMIRFSEWYGWNGTPNEGLRMDVGEVANGILRLEGERRPSYRVADPSIWKVDGGPSIAETMNRHGVVMRRGDNSRHTGYVEVRNRINGDADGPMLYATKNCHAGFWRTMPDLVMDEHRYGMKSEDVDCLVAGTLVDTPTGAKPIEHILEGDFVCTPIGVRKVLKSYVSGLSNTAWARLSNGDVLQGTPHHKVYVAGRGLVPLGELSCYDLLIKRRSKWQEKLLYITALCSLAIKTATTPQSYQRIASYGRWQMVKFLQSITYTIKTTIEAITVLKTLSACTPRNTLSSTTINVTILGTRSEHGQTRKSGEKLYQRTCVSYASRFQKGGLRAAIVETLLRQHTRIKNTAQQSVRKKIIGRLNLAKFVERIFVTKGIIKNNAELVLINAVGNSEERKLVYNLTVDEAHLFYANGILSSNTEQEDHCYDDVRMAVMSRPWIRIVDKTKAPPRDWFQFRDQEPENSWKTM